MLRLLLIVGVVASLASAQALPSCNATVRIDTFIGESATGSLALPELSANCAMLTFVANGGASSGLRVNLRGDYVYTPTTTTEAVDQFGVNVSCLRTALCQMSIFATVSRRITAAPTTRPPATAAAPDACPPLYFQVARGQQLSATLRNHAGQPACSAGRSFELLHNPRIGSVDFTPIGDFRYSAPTTETWDDFTFSMLCGGVQLCRGNAYIMISASVAPSPTTAAPAGPATPVTSGPSSQAPATSEPVFRPSQYQQCRGTCNTDAWKVVPNADNLWDISPSTGAPHVSPRKDGKALNGVDAAWEDGGLVVRAYSKIGNVAVRFPTFEPLQWQLGDLFTGVEQSQRVAATSVPFDLNCLDLQSNAGIAEDVWSWTSVVNRTGHVGAHYASGSDWYQKFGGKHIGCDTFRDSCRYAPLLTPRETQDPAAGGVWSVDIDGCDVTWTGRFSFAALRNMRRRDGTPVWSMTRGHFLEGTISTEAVKPNSWLQPRSGLATNVQAKAMVLDLEPWTRVVVDKTNSKLFSLDAEYFEYAEEGTNDRAFGLNLLFYPHLPDGARTSYMADRHVAGFRWLNQAWSHPDALQCPTCNGTDMRCALNDVSEASFTQDTFFSGSCLNPRVALSRGPSFTGEGCMPSRMHVFNRMGFSQPHYCRSSFQNLTLRGVARGSGSGNTSSSFAFEGQLRLQLLLDNGQMPVVDVDISLMVATATVDGRYSGSIDVCRAAPYWPVYDPLGESLPDAPHDLYSGEPGELCIDRFDRTFGPTGWAVVSYNVDQAPRERTLVEELYVQWPGSPRVYFKADMDLPAGAVWWYDEHPYFNYRSLDERLRNGTISVGEDVQPLGPKDFAFAFTPGALGLAVDLQVTCVVHLRPAEAGDEPGHIIFTQNIRLDPALTSNSRFGPPAVSTAGAENEQHSAVLAMAATGGLIAVVIVVAIMTAVSDTDRPLPAWMPRAVISMKKKNVAAQKKRATRGGIPVEFGGSA